MVRMLLERGAEVDITRVDGALFQAAETLHVDIVREFLSRITGFGEESDSSDSSSSGSHPNPLESAQVAGMPILHYAAHCGYTELVKLLLLFCPELICKKDANKERSIHHAVRGGHTQTVFTLVDAETFPARMKATPELLALAPEGKNEIMYAALHRLPPPSSEMDRGKWLRILFENGRNLIKLCHEMKLAKCSGSSYTFVPPVPVDAETIKSRLENVQGVYNTHTPQGVRGNVIIICNHGFHKESVDKRTGSDIDVMRLERLLRSLNLDVAIHHDCTAEEMLAVISEAKKSLVSGCRIFMLIVMSHGGPGYVLGTDGQHINIKHDLVNTCGGEYWPSMRGKPKLFLIQSCRGKKTAGFMDEVLHDAPEEGEWASVSDIHPRSDILVVYSTCEQYKALRDREHGSWFIEELILVFELFAHQDHVDDLVKKANSLLAMRKSFMTAGLQVAEVSSTLRSKLYLLPKPRSSSSYFCEKRNKQVYSITDEYGYSQEVTQQEHRQWSKKTG